jgi:hypothetical protein
VKSTIEGQPSTTINGEILLFNTRTDGHEAIFAHLYQAEPAPVTRLIVFHVRRTRGAFRTILTGRLSPHLARNGYLKSIYLQLQRTYVVRGERRFYLSATCAAPKGVSVAAFSFAKASMSFEDGRTLSSTLTRSCRVRKWAEISTPEYHTRATGMSIQP